MNGNFSHSLLHTVFGYLGSVTTTSVINASTTVTDAFTTTVGPASTSTGAAGSTTGHRRLVDRSVASGSTATTTTSARHQEVLETWRRNRLETDGTTTMKWDQAYSSVGDEDGESIGILWLPYVVFTIVLLTLIALSFVRFHCQRGDQYKRRREELEDKPVANGGKTLQQPQQANGGAANSETASIRPPVKRGGVPEHLTLFLQFSEVDDDNNYGPPSKDHLDWTGNQTEKGRERRSSAPLRRPLSFADKTLTSAAAQHRSEVPYNSAAAAAAATTTGAQNPAGVAPPVGIRFAQIARRKSAGSASRRPLVFTFNSNGSMVDVRCSNEERTKTFCLAADECSLSGTVAYLDMGSLQGAEDAIDFIAAAGDVATASSGGSSSRSNKVHQNQSISVTTSGPGPGRSSSSYHTKATPMTVSSPGIILETRTNGSSREEALSLLQKRSSHVTPF